MKLGLALNFSVFYYEVMKDPTKACELAKTTFDEALPNLEELKQREYKEATSILGLIKDNLTLWMSEESIWVIFDFGVKWVLKIFFVKFFVWKMGNIILEIWKILTIEEGKVLKECLWNLIWVLKKRLGLKKRTGNLRMIGVSLGILDIS